MAASSRLHTSPVFLGTAFLLFGVAILVKLLNLVGWGLVFVDVEPYQLLEWAVVLLMFEIALMLRQMIEMRVEERREDKAAGGAENP